MASEVFNLAIFLTLKDAASGGLDRFGAKLRQAGKEGREFHKTFEQIRSDLSRDLAIGGVGIAGLALLNKGIESAATYEDAVLALRQAFQENTKFSSFSAPQQEAQMQKLIGLATELGSQLQGDTKSYVEMFTAMNKSGIDAEVTLRGAGRAAAYLANVTGAIRKGTAPQLAEDLGSFGKMFDLKGDEYMKAVQLFAALGDRFNIESGNLIEASKYFFSTAKGIMNLRGIEGALETAKLFAFLKRFAGREGSEAGTSLDAVLTHFVSHKKKVEDLAKDKGIKLEFFDEKGSFQGIENMFAQLEKMRALSPEERGIRLHAIFGEQGARVAQAMVEQGVAGWRNITTEANKSVDVNTQIIQQMETYNAKVEALTGSWENFKASAFTPLMDDAKSFIDTTGSIVNSLQKFSAENQGLMDVLGTLALYGSTALIAYSGIKALTTGVRLLSIVSKFSRGEGLIPYLTGVKEEAAKATTAVVGTTNATKSSTTAIATATSKAEKFKGTIQSIAGSSALKIGVQIVGIAAAEMALTSLIQMWTEAAEKSRQVVANAKDLTAEYDKLVGQGKLFGMPGDYGGSSGTKQELDLLASKFLENISRGRDLETAMNPERKTWWEFFTNPTPYGMAKNQSQFSGPQFNPEVAVKLWREAGITTTVQDPNVLARVLVQLQKGMPARDEKTGELKPTLNFGQIELLIQALEKVVEKPTMDVARELAQKEIAGEKKPEFYQTSPVKQLTQPYQPPFLQNNFQLPMLPGMKPFITSPTPMMPFGGRQSFFEKPMFETQRRSAYQMPDFSAKPFSQAAQLPDFTALTNSTNTLSTSFAELSRQANQQNQNAELLNQQAQNITNFGQSLFDLQQPIGQAQTNIFDLGDTSGKAASPIQRLASSANSVVGGLNNVANQLANWKAPVPQVTTYTIGVPAGSSPVVGVQPPTKASGGTVLKEGLVYVHAGEDIMPASVTRQYREPQTFANIFRQSPKNYQNNSAESFASHSFANYQNRFSNRIQSNLLSNLVSSANNQSSTLQQINFVNSLSQIDRRQSNNLSRYLPVTRKTGLSLERTILPSVTLSNLAVDKTDKRSDGLASLLQSGRDADAQRQARFEEVKNFAPSSNKTEGNVTINYSPQTTINGADKKAELDFQAMLNEHVMEIGRLVARRMNNGRIRA